MQIAAADFCANRVDHPRYECREVFAFLSWFQHHHTGKHRVSQKFIDTFGPPRPCGQAQIDQRYMDVAFALQRTLEETGLHIARWLHARTGLRRICLAGGVALNSVMNGRILLETPFEESPAA